MRCRVAVGLILAAALLAPAAGRVEAYSGSSAAAYADRWWNKYDDVFYPHFSNDCTNFVSAAVHEGGYSMHYPADSGQNPWYYYHDGYWGWTNSLSWSVVQYNRGFFNTDAPGGWLVTTAYGKKTAASSGIAGDAIYYAWRNDHTFATNSHAALVTVTSGAATTGGSVGNLVDAHTNFRYHEYWTLYNFNTLWPSTYIEVWHISSLNR